MATNTYVALNKATISGSTTSTVTFGSIPSTYTDLVIVFSGGMSVSGEVPLVKFNGDSSTTYSILWLFGTGAAISSYRRGSMPYLPMGWQTGFSSTTENNLILSIQNYANTNVYKSCLERSNNGTATGTPGLAAGMGLWRNNAAITSIEFYTSAGYFVDGSTVSLYGIKATATGTGTAKATGGTISYDSFGYVYHTFTSTGTFTPSQAISADILVVAGGGGGGGTVGGGGGAGGLLGFTSQSLSATGYTCQVGGGGAGSSTNTNSGSNGVNSQFGALTAAIGGGGGVGYDGGTGATGGSGGGNSGLSGYAGSGTSGQGFGGGTGGGQLGGGGGGASAVGGSYGNFGAGGNGSSAYSIWGIVTGQGQNVSGINYFAGGGGGGTNNQAGGNADTTANIGGYGGGGRGGTATGPGVATGTANTGGGGGGGRGNGSYAGASAGSGIIIVRYYGL